MQENVAKILDFMRAMERVCLVERDTRMTDGKPETDAAHIFKLAFLVMLVYPYLQKKYNSPAFSATNVFFFLFSSSFRRK